jgi:hypothetical protein
MNKKHEPRRDIRAHLVALGISQQEIANAVGCKRSWVAQAIDDPNRDNGANVKRHVARQLRGRLGVATTAGALVSLWPSETP